MALNGRGFNYLVILFNSVVIPFKVRIYCKENEDVFLYLKKKNQA
jgi:hypothetical protein